MPERRWGCRRGTPIIIFFIKNIKHANNYSDAVTNKTLQGHFTMSTSMQQMS